MKDIFNFQETQFELFNSLMQLSEDFGHRNVVYALARLLDLEVEADRCCVSCQRKAIWMHSQLVQLVNDYDEQFPPTQALQKVNNPGSGLVQ